MKFQRKRLASNNPIKNFVMIFIGAITLAASLLLGMFAFIIVASLLIIIIASVGIRLWWLKRKILKKSPTSDQPDVIEGEYRDISEKK